MFCLLRDRCVFVFVSYLLTFSLLLLGAMGRSRPSVSLILMDRGSLVPQGSTTQEALGTNTWSLLSRFGFSAQRAVSTDVKNEERTFREWNCNIFWKFGWCLRVQKVRWYFSAAGGYLSVRVVLHSEFDLWIWIEVLHRISNCSLNLNIRKWTKFTENQWNSQNWLDKSFVENCGKQVEKVRVEKSWKSLSSVCLSIYLTFQMTRDQLIIMFILISPWTHSLRGPGYAAHSQLIWTECHWYTHTYIYIHNVYLSIYLSI